MRDSSMESESTRKNCKNNQKSNTLATNSGSIPISNLVYQLSNDSDKPTSDADNTTAKINNHISSKYNVFIGIQITLGTSDNSSLNR